MSYKRIERMSNSRINMAVAQALGAKVQKSCFGTDYLMPDFTVSEISPSGPVGKFNPCNSWADAGPIIESSGISLRKRHGGNWRAENEWGISHHHDHENPLLAAMIVFLMIQEGK